MLTDLRKSFTNNIIMTSICWNSLHSVTRPACQAAASIDRYLLPAGLSAANSPAAAAAVNWRDRQTDGRTDGHSTVLWRPPRNKYVGPPDSRAEIYAACVSYAAAGDAHRPPLHGSATAAHFAAAARAATGQTDAGTRHRFNTLTA